MYERSYIRLQQYNSKSSQLHNTTLLYCQRVAGCRALHRTKKLLKDPLVQISVKRHLCKARRIRPNSTMEVSSLNQPLDKASQEIRLLRITSAGFDETVSCTSFIQSLREPSFQSFNALSYVWGDANDTVPMIIDGYMKPVTRNLDIALRHLRDPRNKCVSGSMTLPLWIDAVCIDQKDIDERNHQVRLMKYIYGLADRVLIWLGPGVLLHRLAL